MRLSGPLPVAVPEAARAWLDERRELLTRRLNVVAERAARDALDEVRIAGSKLTITPQGQCARSGRGLRHAALRHAAAGAHHRPANSAIPESGRGVGSQPTS